MSETKKAKTLFDHLNAITSTQDPEYFDRLTDEDKKTWSNFMIHRFLSMNYDYIELIAEIQPLAQTLEPALLYKLLIGLIPKGKVYLRYIKGKHEDKVDKQIVNLLIAEYQCSENTAIDYYDILLNIKDGNQYIEYLKEKYGVASEEKKKRTKK